MQGVNARPVLQEGLDVRHPKRSVLSLPWSIRGLSKCPAPIKKDFGVTCPDFFGIRLGANCQSKDAAMQTCLPKLQMLSGSSLAGCTLHARNIP